MPILKTNPLFPERIFLAFPSISHIVLVLKYQFKHSFLVINKDEDVTKKSGIYEYVLTRNERYLSIRTFTDKMKRESYEQQQGICTKCLLHFELSEMEADHITPWHSGGKTTPENCQMLCKNCNRTKSGK